MLLWLPRQDYLQGQELFFLKRRARRVVQSGEFFESKHFALGSFYVHAFSDFGSAQSRRADTLCRNAKPSH
jgi:hypothetical protein